MSSRIHINGRTYAASRDYRAGLVCGSAPATQALTVADEDSGQRPTDGTPIPPESADSPFRAGIPYEDPHEGVVYRVVANLRVSDGWGTAAFWTKRLRCNYGDLLELCQMAWFDAAIEQSGTLKRYRCRDELRVREWLAPRLHGRAALALPMSQRAQAEARKTQPKKQIVWRNIR